MIIYVTRHGQPTVSLNEIDVPGDPPLSQLGIEQAQSLGRRFRTMGFNGLILTSPYRRTVETADLIARELDITFHFAVALRERIKDATSYIQGLSLEQLRNDYERVDPDAQLPYPWSRNEPEDGDAVEARVRPLIDDLIAKDTGDVLLIGHGATTSRAMRYLLTTYAPDGLDIKNYGWNCFLSAIRIKPEPELLYVCNVDHLRPDQITCNTAPYSQDSTTT